MKFSTILGILLTPIVIIVFSTSLLLFHMPFYEALLEETNVDDQGLTQQFFHFILEDRPMNGLTVNELLHLEDVKQVIFWFRVVTVISLAAYVLLLALAFDKRILVYGGGLTIVLIGLAAVVPFDRLFLWFHVVTFPQGNYLFSQTAVLPSTYTEEFFGLFAQTIALWSLIFSLIFMLLHRIGTYTFKHIYGSTTMFK